MTRPLRIFMWHVHGSWMTAFVQGRHEVYVPVLPDRGPNGRGRAQTWTWPGSVHEVTPEQAPSLDVDVLILQRPEELELSREWLRRKPGRDVPTIYLEHNAPQGRINEMLHPIANRPELTLVHVTHFNRLFWDAGSTRSVVIEHGIVDPGHLYRGELACGVVVVNEARRRGRLAGLDLLERFSKVAPLDVIGMDAASLGGIENLTQAQLHEAMASRRVYLHLMRWTSLGLSLLEAMFIGMPIVALATTEAPEAVPAGAGVVSNRLDVLEATLRRLIADPDFAHACGREARRIATQRYGLGRFLADWDRLFEEVVG